MIPDLLNSDLINHISISIKDDFYKIYFDHMRSYLT